MGEDFIRLAVGERDFFLAPWTGPTDDSGRVGSGRLVAGLQS